MSLEGYIGYFILFIIGTIITAFIFRWIFDMSLVHKRIKRMYRLMEQIAKEQGVPLETIDRIRKKGE